MLCFSLCCVFLCPMSSPTGPKRCTPAARRAVRPHTRHDVPCLSLEHQHTYAHTAARRTPTTPAHPAPPPGALPSLGMRAHCVLRLRHIYAVNCAQFTHRARPYCTAFFYISYQLFDTRFTLNVGSSGPGALTTMRPFADHINGLQTPKICSS